MIRAALLALVAALLLAAAPAASARFVVDRSGGFAGVSDHLVVRGDGSGWRTDRSGSRVELGPADTREVRRALRASRFRTLRPRYAPPGVVDDGFEVRLRDRGHEVVVLDGAEHVPARLQRLVEAASALLTADAPA